MAVLTVGVGQEYATIASAVAATKDGDTVLVSAGTYTNDFITVSHNITMTSVGGQATLVATSAPPNGKAILDVSANLTISGFGFTGAAVGDGNGAGIRYEAGNLDVENCVFWDNQDGILANASTGNIVINNSEFSHNGAGDGYTHNIYIGAVASLLVENSYFHDAVAGHEIKSRALATTIVNNRIFDNGGDGSYSIDLPDGGVDVVQNNVIEKGADTENWITLHFGGEGTPYAGSSLSVTGNTIVNDNPNGYLISNQSGLSTVNMSGNSEYGYAPSHVVVAGGTVTETGDTTLSTRPTLDLSTRAPAVSATTQSQGTVVAPTIAAQVPATDVLRSYGTQGAVVASGHILTVGANAEFATLAEALSVSADGDTIEVAAGTYYNDLATVTHKVIIEGVNGIANFIQTITTAPNQGILTITTDATVRDLAFTGATNYSGAEAGIMVTGGNVTLNDVVSSNNDIGINTADNTAISLSIYNSNITSNGNVARGTNNVNIGGIESFTLRNSFVYGATTGHEISDHAENSDIENDTISDGPTAQASFLLDLGLGGNAKVANNVFDKGVNAANGVLVYVGGEGTSYSNSNVQLTGNSFISDYVSSGHPYTYFIVGDASAGSAPPTTATGNVFYGGVAGSAQLINATGSGNTSGAMASKPSGSPALLTSLNVPGPLVPQAGPNTLTLGLSETKGSVDGQFTVSVDGTVVGGGLVTADHATGAPQSFTYSGSWGAGPHTIAVTALNIGTAIGPQVQTLFTDSISLDGSTVSPETAMYTWAPVVTATLQGKIVVPGFDAAYYLANNPDVAAAGVDPLQHYLTHGWAEGRNPSALFNTNYYLNQNPDVKAAGVNPLLHYDEYGWKEGRDPSSLFSTNAYLANNPTVVAENINPLQQYEQAGQAAGTAIYAATPHATTNSDPMIDTSYYYANDTLAATTGVDPGTSYADGGWQSGANPDAWFNSSYYLLVNPDVKAAGVDPLMHFETSGWKEGRDPSQYFSIKAYDAANPGAATSGVDPLLSYITSGQAAANPTEYAYPEAKMFDATYYLAHNPDVAAAHVDPLLHYEQFGWKEGRDPSAGFDTNKYLAANPDVKAAGIDPLWHYANFGQNEQRAIFSV